MQKYPSGSRGSPAKGVVRETVARVQIPPSAPFTPVAFGSGCLLAERIIAFARKHFAVRQRVIVCSKKWNHRNNVTRLRLTAAIAPYGEQSLFRRGIRRSSQIPPSAPFTPVAFGSGCLLAERIPKLKNRHTRQQISPKYALFMAILSFLGQYSYFFRKKGKYSYIFIKVYL